MFSRLFKNLQLVPRSDRIPIEDYHSVKVVLKKQTLPVHNISLYGFALSYSGDQELEDSEELECQLYFKDEAITVKIKVVYVKESFIGVSVIEGKEEFKRKLSRYFESELQGLSLRKIDPEKLNPRKEGTPHLFYGDHNHELFYITKDNDIVFFQINYQGLIIEMNAKQFISVGEIHEDTFSGYNHKGSNLVGKVEEINYDLINHTKRFLMFIKDLPIEHKEFIKQKLDRLVSGT